MLQGSMVPIFSSKKTGFEDLGTVAVKPALDPSSTTELSFSNHFISFMCSDRNSVLTLHCTNDRFIPHVMPVNNWSKYLEFYIHSIVCTMKMKTKKMIKKKKHNRTYLSVQLLRRELNLLHCQLLTLCSISLSPLLNYFLLRDPLHRPPTQIQIDL